MQPPLILHVGLLLTSLGDLAQFCPAIFPVGIFVRRATELSSFKVKRDFKSLLFGHIRLDQKQLGCNLVHKVCPILNTKGLLPTSRTLLASEIRNDLLLDCNIVLLHLRWDHMLERVGIHDRCMRLWIAEQPGSSRGRLSSLRSIYNIAVFSEGCRRTS